jgi:4-diphosphocytidyl-2-C-methyl-D-erythritol kinase
MTGAPRRVRIEARAKLNLGLAIGPRRADRFHDLVTVFQSVSLADTVVVERAARGVTLTVRHENAAARGRAPREGGRDVPRGAGNLAVRAAQLVLARLALPGGVRIRLTKRIPSRAGLGGGSADAAAALVATALVCGMRLARADALALAAELGSDVPFAVVGGTALGRGRGEQLQPLAIAAAMRAVIAVPRWRISTTAAFAQIDRTKYGLTAWGAKLRSAQRLERERVSAAEALSLGNTFEEVLGARRRDFDSLRGRLLAAGVTHVRMTGSGSAVFGILPPHVRAAAVVRRFVGDEQVFVVRSERTGLLRKNVR